jgi:hypothetical protein
LGNNKIERIEINMRFEKFLPHLDGVRCLAAPNETVIEQHEISKVVITTEVLPIGSLFMPPGFPDRIKVDVWGSKERNYATLTLAPSEAKELARRLVEAAEQAGDVPCVRAYQLGFEAPKQAGDIPYVRSYHLR